MNVFTPEQEIRIREIIREEASMKPPSASPQKFPWIDARGTRHEIVPGDPTITVKYVTDGVSVWGSQPPKVSVRVVFRKKLDEWLLLEGTDEAALVVYRTTIEQEAF